MQCPAAGRPTRVGVKDVSRSALLLHSVGKPWQKPLCRIASTTTLLPATPHPNTCLCHAQRQYIQQPLLVQLLARHAQQLAIVRVCIPCLESTRCRQGAGHRRQRENTLRRTGYRHWKGWRGLQRFVIGTSWRPLNRKDRKTKLSEALGTLAGTFQVAPVLPVARLACDAPYQHLCGKGCSAGSRSGVARLSLLI